jgi:HEAT repeat protein
VYAHARGSAGRGLTRCARRLLAPLTLAAGLAGCAGFWDEVTSRDFKMKNLWEHQDPLWVIQNTTDGDKKAKALRSLREPLANGGSQQEQEVAVKTLVWSATSDEQPACRQAAIDALRHFRDERAVEGLKDAYYRADRFNPDTAAILKCQALAALGDTAQPGALDLLLRVLREPPVEGSEVDKQQKMDERIAAARALAHFPQPQPAAALVAVLRTSPDVALRNNAHQSLVQITGRELPPEAAPWDEYFRKHGDKDAFAGPPSNFDKFIHLVSGSEDKP